MVFDLCGFGGFVFVDFVDDRIGIDIVGVIGVGCGLLGCYVVGSGWVVVLDFFC